MRSYGAVGALFVTCLFAPRAEAVGVVCPAEESPVVIEARADGLLVGHVEWRSSVKSPECDSPASFYIRFIGWTVTKCDAEGACTAVPFFHPMTTCRTPQGAQPCPDVERVAVKRPGPGLYSISLEAVRLDGMGLSDRVEVRVGRRPSRAR